jgi:hypothetical protein
VVEQMPNGRRNLGSRRDVILIRRGLHPFQQSLTGNGGKELFGRRGVGQDAQDVSLARGLAEFCSS